MASWQATQTPLARRGVALALAGTAACCALLAVSSPAVARTGSTRACAPRAKTVAGVKSIAFCGPATATVRFIEGEFGGIDAAGRSATFRSGQCLVKDRKLYVYIGVVPKTVLDGGFIYGKKLPSYFTLEVPAKAGMQKLGVLGNFSFQNVALGLKPFSSQVTLARSLKEGSFSGSLESDLGIVKGSFRCG